jgi:hypothetical protein
MHSRRGTSSVIVRSSSSIWANVSARFTARARALYEHYIADAPQGDLVAAARARLSELGPEPVVAPPPVSAPTTTITVPTPPAAAASVGTASAMTVRPNPMFIDTPTPLLRRPALWIGVGIGVALLAASAVIYEESRHHAPSMCTPPGCVSL